MHISLKSSLNFIILGATLMLGSACSVGRKSATAGANRGVLSNAVVLDKVIDNGYQYPNYGEFQLQLNLTKNFAYLDVLAMADGWGGQSYRVHAFRDGKWWTLARGLDGYPGETIELDAIQGHKIYEYTQWIVEFEAVCGASGNGKCADFEPSARVVQDETLWPELADYIANKR